MQITLGIAPFLPPDVREEDRPVRIDGSPVAPPTVANTACLNSPRAQQYALAAIAELVDHYPEADGLMLDWVEFGAYKLDEHFTCFCRHCQTAAERAGFDWILVRRDVHVLWQWLHKLSRERIVDMRRAASSASEIVELLARYPGWLQFLQFKARSVAAFYERVRLVLDEMQRPKMQLTARGWCPPWNRSSGSDYHALAGVCQAVAPKLFTFDHAVLPRWSGETLLAWNQHLADLDQESEILEALLTWMNLADDIKERRLAHYNIPAPDERHPANLDTYRARLEEVAAQVSGRANFFPIAHPYLPEWQWREMVGLIQESQADGMWVNMYGYLSDRKLQILKECWN